MKNTLNTTNTKTTTPYKNKILSTVASALFLTTGACKKDELPPENPTPIKPIEKIDHPIEKIDHPTGFSLNTTNLPEGITIDSISKIITTPLDTPDTTIITLCEQGEVSDTDGEAGIKTVKIQGNKVIITIRGTNGKTNKKESKIIEYTINRQATAIPTNDTTKYKEPRSESIVAYYKEQQGIIDGMRIPAIRALLQDNVLKPTNQKTTVLEVGEHNHIFGEDMKKLINNIEGINYILLDLKDYNNKYSQEMRKTFEEIVNQNTQNNNFLIYESNRRGARKRKESQVGYVGDILEQNNQTYTASSEGYTEELASQDGQLKISLPVYKRSNGKRYFVQDSSRGNPEDNPFTNSIESPLIGGIDFGSSSGASAANAATRALGIHLLQRMGIQVDKAFRNSIFENTEYDECFEPAYWIDPNTKEEHIKGKVLIWNKFIEKFNTFGLNTEEIQKLQPGQKVPLLKHWDKIDNIKLILQEEKGITRENDIAYLDYDLLTKQGINAKEFIQNPEYTYIIADKKTRKLYRKPTHQK